MKRFWEKVRKTESCWLWTAAMNGPLPNCGYGIFVVDGTRSRVRRMMAHRFSYELANGPVPEGLELDHLCRNRLCVRPDHLEAVTHSENVRRGVAPSAVNMSKDRCIRGHDFEPERDGSKIRRRCYTCLYAKRKAKRDANPEKHRAYFMEYMRTHREEQKVYVARHKAKKLAQEAIA